jgi:hypothetical protein
MNSVVENHFRFLVHGVSLVSAFLFFYNTPVLAQVKVFYIKSEQTDPAIETVHGPNLAVYDPQASPRHQLFLFINGTGSKATNSLGMGRIFARWGYPVVSLDYENNVLAASLAHSTNSSAFDQYRKAIITGAPVSDWVKANAANSVLNRVHKLLVYLAAHDPRGGWDDFIKDGKPLWNRIIVAGHSQGSGHAAYLGKMFKVDRVLIFSGPQDYLDNFHEPAPWLSGPSATPPSRFFAFLSRNDPFNVNHQEANCLKLMQLPKLEALNVKPGEVIHGDHQIFVNDFPKKSAHGSTISGQFTNVWDYMLTENRK